MPSAPSVHSGNYPTCEDVLQFARSVANDMLQSTAGNILTDTAPFTLTYLNAAIEQVSKELANNGCPQTVTDNFIMSPLPPVPHPDPSIQTFLSQNEFFDGEFSHLNPHLPPNIILPLELWERYPHSGSQFMLMQQPQEGLPSRLQGAWLGYWEWREGRIWMIGSTSTEEIRMRYMGSLPKILNGADFTKTTILVQGGTRAMGYWIATYFVEARGGAAAAFCRQRAQEATDQLITEFVRAQQRVGYRQQGYRDGSDRISGYLGGTRA